MLEKQSNLFHFFDLRPNYEIDKTELKNKYYEKLKNDRKNHKEIIQKYKILSDDFSRYEYLLGDKKKYELSDRYLERLIDLNDRSDRKINMLINKCKALPFNGKKLEIWKYLKRILYHRKNASKE